MFDLVPAFASGPADDLLRRVQRDYEEKGLTARNEDDCVLGGAYVPKNPTEESKTNALSQPDKTGWTPENLWKWLAFAGSVLSAIILFFANEKGRSGVEWLLGQVRNGSGNPVEKVQPVNIGLLWSDDMAFSRRIKSAFCNELEKLIPGSHIDDLSFRGPSAPYTNAQASEVWKLKSEDLAQRHWGQPYDYIVTIGTQATKAMEIALAGDFGRSPFIFLGASDPIDIGAVDALDHRDDWRQVAGVRYGPGIEDVTRRLHALFPHRKLIYLYDRSAPQDVVMERRMHGTKEFNDGIIVNRELADPITITDMPDSEAIYFGWFGLETLFDKGNVARSLLKERIIIASTEDNVRPNGMSPVSIAPSDTEVGEMGARIIAKHRKDKESLGRQDIGTPINHTIINRTTANQQGLEIGTSSIANVEFVSGEK